MGEVQGMDINKLKTLVSKTHVSKKLVSKKLVPELDRDTLIYVAGFIDLKGHFYVRKQRTRLPSGKISYFYVNEIRFQSDQKLITKWLAENIGGTGGSDYHNDQIKLGFRWRMCADEAGVFCEKILPFLKFKRESCKKFIEFRKTYDDPVKDVTHRNKLRDEICAQLFTNTMDTKTFHAGNKSVRLYRILNESVNRNKLMFDRIKDSKGVTQTMKDLGNTFYKLSSEIQIGNAERIKLKKIRCTATRSVNEIRKKTITNFLKGLEIFEKLKINLTEFKENNKSSGFIVPKKVLDDELDELSLIENLYLEQVEMPMKQAGLKPSTIT